MYLLLGSLTDNRQKFTEKPTSLGRSKSRLSAAVISPGRNKPPKPSARHPATSVQPHERAVVIMAMRTAAGIATWCDWMVHCAPKHIPNPSSVEAVCVSQVLWSQENLGSLHTDCKTCPVCEEPVQNVSWLYWSPRRSVGRPLASRQNQSPLRPSSPKNFASTCWWLALCFCACWFFWMILNTSASTHLLHHYSWLFIKPEVRLHESELRDQQLPSSSKSG